MFQFVANLLKRNGSPTRRQNTSARLAFESLESRDLMACDMCVALEPLPKLPHEQVSILFPVFQKAELVKDVQGLVGYTSPELLPAVQHIDPTFLPAVQNISPEIKPVHIDLAILSLAYDSASVQK